MRTQCVGAAVLLMVSSAFCMPYGVFYPVKRSAYMPNFYPASPDNAMAEAFFRQYFEANPPSTAGLISGLRKRAAGVRKRNAEVVNHILSDFDALEKLRKAG